MKQKIGTLKPVDEPTTDLDVVFVAIYNLIYEKIEQEPKRGIVVSKGNPNQRKVTWDEVMRYAHMLEDFFQLREMRTGCKTCGECVYWKSVSKASPHLGKCLKHKEDLIHQLNSCKKYQPRRTYES